jgi:hypothetical protein
VLLFASLKRICIARFRDGNILVVFPVQLPNYFLLRDMILENLTGKTPQDSVSGPRGIRQILDASGGRFIIVPTQESSSICGAFFRKSFYDEDLTGCEVVDVGAHDGGAVIYFASKGATVHAYEPVPASRSSCQRVSSPSDNMDTSHRVY